jgi:uncharacterized membrane protein YoaK (UPF0700 family)
MYAMIILTGFAMGSRNATTRRLAVADLPTTVLTLTVTGLAADITTGGNSHWKRRLAGVFAIFGGALAGALLISFGGLSAALAAAGFLVLLGTLFCVRGDPQTAKSPH